MSFGRNCNHRLWRVRLPMNSVAVRPAARSRPRAEGCNSFQSMPPFRSAAGWSRVKIDAAGIGGPQPPGGGGPQLASRRPASSAHSAGRIPNRNLCPSLPGRPI